MYRPHVFFSVLETAFDLNICFCMAAGAPGVTSVKVMPPLVSSFDCL